MLKNNEARPKIFLPQKQRFPKRTVLTVMVLTGLYLGNRLRGSRLFPAKDGGRKRHRVFVCLAGCIGMGKPLGFHFRRTNIGGSPRWIYLSGSTVGLSGRNEHSEDALHPI